MIAGEIEQFDGVFELASFFGIFGDRVEDILNVAVELVDDAGTPDAVIDVDATEEEIELSRL